MAVNENHINEILTVTDVTQRDDFYRLLSRIANVVKLFSLLLFYDVGKVFRSPGSSLKIH